MKKFMIFLLATTLIAFTTVAMGDPYHIYEGESIQAAIDDSQNYDPIIVHPGTYYEGIATIFSIGRPLTLQSSDGAASTTLEGGILLQANNITVEGFTISNGASMGGEFAGIYILASYSGHTISSNILNGPGKEYDPTNRGIVTGIGVTNLTVSDNTIRYWTSGVYLNPGSIMTLTGNYFFQNTAGIGSDGISDVTIMENTFTSNDEGWGVGNAGANVRANYNRFLGNTANGVKNYCVGPPFTDCVPGDTYVDATNNYWGDECGPNEDGDTVEGYVFIDPWLPDCTVYEHGEFGTIDGWEIYADDGDATISNVYDADRGSQVIELSGSGGTKDGYNLRGENGWHNTTQLMIEWSMKTSEYFKFFVEVETTETVRYLYYSPVDEDLGILEGALYPHHHLGSSITNDQWHTFVRDLNSDLQDVYEEESIVEVNGIWIRGSMSVDDIRLLWPDKSLSISDVTIPEDGGPAIFKITVNDAHCQDITVDYTTSDGSAVAGADYETISGTATILEGETEVQITAVPIVNDNYAEYEEAFFVVLRNSRNAWIDDGEGQATITDDSDPIWMYEDAENLNTLGWSVYDNIPPGAKVFNVYDTDRGSRVIELVSSGTKNGFYKGDEDGSPWDNSTRHVIQWSMKTTNDFQFFVEVETDVGIRYLYYSPVDVDYGTLQGLDYPHHGLGSDILDGQWHTFTRDLAADLQDVYPGESILEVDGVWIRGNMRIDDIQLIPPMGGLSISDATISEDGGSALFTISSSDPAVGDYTVQYTTVDNTAVEPGDYTATMGTVTIADGTDTVNVYVDIIDDGDFEGNEIFLVVLSNPLNTVIADDTGIGTIEDNEPGLAIDDVTVSEDGGSAMFTITATATYGSNIEVDYTTFDNTAVDPDDYTGKTERATITPGSTFVNVYVDIIDDGDWEKEEAFFVELSNPTNAWMSDDAGVATITDNDAPNHTVYEDAEDGLTDGWEIYDDDPEDATFSNIYDADFHSYVIELDGVALNPLNNGFYISEGGGWHNSSYFNFRWSMKATGNFQFFVEVLTTSGARYLYYSPVDENYGNDLGIQYPHHGLGSGVIDGQWHTFHRDLAADLADVQPGVTIIEVNAVWIRGYMRIDDIIQYE